MFCMPGTALIQRQQQRAIPVQIQANAILSLGILELQQFIETEAMENPALSIDDSLRCPVCGFLTPNGPCPVCGGSARLVNERLNSKSSERDYLDTVFAASADEAFDPFRTVAGAIDVREHLRQQARVTLGGRQLRIAEYIIDCIDEDGYFREPLYDTAEQFAAAVPEVEAVLSTIQTFDPPGIGSRDLRECLLIQLRALGNDSLDARTAERMLSDHWEDFSRMRLKTLAASMRVSPSEVRGACEFIKENLNPRPASLYRAPFGDLAPCETAAVVPDVIIHRHGDTLTAEVTDSHSRSLGLDATYDRAYQAIRSGDSSLGEDDARHVKEHVERVRCILDAIRLRKETLGRVATELVECQREFVLHGAPYLKPLFQKDIAKRLEVHESTVCRAIAGKHCRLPSGEVVSFDVFFDSALPIRDMVGQLIARSTEPLSDGEIAKRLAEQGVTIARRTVAKYREQLRVLPYQLRAA